MANKSVVKIEGIIEEALPGLLFRVRATGGDPDIEINKEILAHLAGKMKLYRIKVVAGDKVLIEMPNVNDRRGRITRRL